MIWMGNEIDFARNLGELLDVPLVVCEPSSGSPNSTIQRMRETRSPAPKMISDCRSGSPVKRSWA